MDNSVWAKVVVPTLTTGSAFIGITTLDDTGEDNFVGELAETRNADGDRLYNVIFISRVCDRCRKEGVEISCKHKMHEIPYWQDEKRHEDVLKINRL